MSESISIKQTISELFPKPDIICEKCQRTFRHRRSLYAHIRKFHGENFSLKGNQICGLCNEGLLTLPLLHEHLKTQHDVKLNFIDRTFYSNTEFLQWKSDIENKNKSSFVRKGQVDKKDRKVKHVYYKCHHSGFSNINHGSKCKVKNSGSINTGSTCPAMINTSTHIIDDIYKIKVKYQSVHVGHEMQIGTIQLITEKETAADGIINVPEERKKQSPVHCTLGPVEKNKFELMKNYKTKCISNSKKVFKEESSLVDKEEINKKSSLVDKREMNDILSPVDNEEINAAAAEINKQTPVEKLNKESALIVQLSNLRRSNRRLKNSLYNKNKRIEQLNKQLSELKTKVKCYESGQHHFSLENMLCRSESSEKPIFILQQIKPKTPSNTKCKTPSNTKCKGT